MFADEMQRVMRWCTQQIRANLNDQKHLHGLLGFRSAAALALEWWHEGPESLFNRLIEAADSDPVFECFAWAEATGDYSQLLPSDAMAPMPELGSAA